MRWFTAGLAATLLATPAFAQRLPDPVLDGSGEGSGSTVADAPTSSEPAGRRRVDVDAYVEAGQVLVAEIHPGDEVFTYTEVAAGIDASIQRRRVEAQVSYRYEHRFSYDDRFSDDDLHTGLARASVGIGRSLTLEGGAIATRSQYGGGTLFDFGGDNSDATNLYSVYAGPSFADRIGRLDVSAAYRIGYTKVDTPDGFDEFDGGDYFDDSLSQAAQASIGMAAGNGLPFGWTVSGAWTREDVGLLDGRFEGWFARGDVTVPLSPTLAAVGGVGWESLEASQRAPLVDADGAPAIDGDGRLVTDPDSPRLTAYAEDGLYWDVGVLWRPSPRTSLEVRAGERYDSFTAFGAFSWQAGRQTALSIVVYDSVDSFGRRLTDDLADLPTSFRNTNNGLGGGFSGCVFGVGDGNAGGCLNSTLASLASANYRARGVDAVLSSASGLWSYGLGAGYATREYFAPDLGPGVTLFGIEDENAYLQAYVARSLTRRSSIDGQLYATWYNAGFDTSPDVYSAGALTTYNYSFGRLEALASLGVQGFEQEGFDENVLATGQVGLRYNF